MPDPLPKPIPLYVTIREGGEYIPFPCRYLNNSERGITVHSIHFSDGSEFDALNGWRSQLRDPYEWHNACRRAENMEYLRAENRRLRAALARANSPVRFGMSD